MEIVVDSEKKCVYSYGDDSALGNDSRSRLNNQERGMELVDENSFNPNIECMQKYSKL